jgi:hypothetical protein
VVVEPIERSQPKLREMARAGDEVN